MLFLMRPSLVLKRTRPLLLLTDELNRREVSRRFSASVMRFHMYALALFGYVLIEWQDYVRTMLLRMY